MTDRSARPERRGRGLLLWCSLLLVALAVIATAVRSRRRAPESRGTAPSPYASASRTESGASLASSSPPPPVERLPARTHRAAAAATHPRRAEPASPAPPPAAAADTAARLASADTLAREAEDALREERDEDAFSAADACLRRDPTDARCVRSAAVALARTGRTDEARSYVSECLEHDAADIPCLVAYAQLALTDRDQTLAGLLAWRLSQLAPDSADTLDVRARLADLRGDPAAAERAYRQACRAGLAAACLRLGAILTTAQP